MTITDKPYLVPRAVIARFELIPGVGLGQLLAGLAGATFGVAFQFLAAYVAGLLLGPSPWIMFLRIAVVAGPASFAFAATRQNLTGQSPWQTLRARRGWLSRPKLYLYRREGV